MNPIERLRARINEMVETRSSKYTEFVGLDAAAVAETRDMTPEEDARSAALADELTALDADLVAARARLEQLEAIERNAANAKPVPQVMRKVEHDDNVDVRSLSRGEANDRALKLLEQRSAVAHLKTENVDKVDSLLRMGKTANYDADYVARLALLTERPVYRSAFLKAITQPTPMWTADEARAMAEVHEFRAMSIGTDASGGYGVPVLIDPSIILTAQGSLNPFRRISRVIPITNDEWKGVSSAGVTWSYDSEAAAVSDDSPTLAQPNVVTFMARGFIPYSIEFGMDYPGAAEQLQMLLVEGYDELQASAFATGNGSSAPYGILTALDANTNVEVTPTTDGAFGAVDINKVWGALPDRFKANATWVMNHDVGNEVSSFSTSGQGSFYTVNLADGNAPQLKGRPVEFASYFPDFTGTTGASNILVVGDFRNYVIVERVGMAVEYIPHLFDVTNNRPTGQRGLFAYARHGADSVNDLAFRLLQNQ